MTKKNSTPNNTPPKVNMTIKKRKLFKALAEGQTQRAAGLLAGYSKKNVDSVVGHELEKPHIRMAFAQFLTKAGLSDDCLSNHIRRLTGFCKKTIIRGAEGDEIVEVEDGQVQLGAVRLAVQLKGHLIEKREIFAPGIEEILEALRNK